MLRKDRLLAVDAILLQWDEEVGERPPDLAIKIGTFVNIYGASAVHDQMLRAADGDAEDSEAVLDEIRDRLRINRRAAFGRRTSLNWRPR